MNLVACADLHLDSGLAGLAAVADAPPAPDGGASRRVLARVIDTCIDRRAAALLVAGDLVDRDCTDPATIAFLVAQLQRLRPAGIPAFLAWGNHDVENDLARAIAWPDHVHVFPADRATTTTFEVGGVRVAIHGRSLPTPTLDENVALRFPPPVAGAVNLGLLHTGLDKPEPHTALAPCAPEDLLARGYQGWVLGHVHQRRIVADGPCPILYPGNLQGRWAGETGGKGCAILSIEDGAATTTPEFLDLDDLRWSDEPVDVSAARSLAEVERLALDRLVASAREAEGRRLACRIRLVRGAPLLGPLSDARPSLTAALRARAPRGTWVADLLVEAGPTPP